MSASLEFCTPSRICPKLMAPTNLGQARASLLPLVGYLDYRLDLYRYAER